MKTHAQLTGPSPWLPFVLAALCLTAAVAYANSAEDKGKADTGKMKFELFQDAKKAYRWRLRASNGQLMATAGQGFSSKDEAKKAIGRVKEGADKAKFEVYQDAKKEYRWRMKASNGQIVAIAPDGYKTKASCEKAVERIKSAVKTASIEEKV